MKRPSLLVRRWHWFALLLVPFLGWGIVLAVVPTDWARDKLVDRLAQATGRSVKIGALRLGPLGELRIIDLAIAESGTPSDPWLEVDEAKMDVHLGQVFCGRCDPKEVEAEGVKLRIWRKKDGTTEVSDLLPDAPDSTLQRPKVAQGESSTTIALKVSGASLRIIDDSSGNRVDLADVSAKGTWGRKLVLIEEMHGQVNGGTFAMAARLDHDPAGPRFEAELKAHGVEIDGGLPVLGCFVPVVAGATDGVGGKFDLNLALKGQGTTRSELHRSLRGHGSVAIDPIDLEGSRFLAQLNVLGDWPKDKDGRIGSVTTDFQVGRGRITTEDLTIRASRFPFVLGGWTDFDGRFDYVAQVDRIAAKLPKEAKGWMADLKVNFDQLAGLRMRGSIDHVEVTVHGHPLTGDPDRPDVERARFRDTARRIRDRFFR